MRKSFVLIPTVLLTAVVSLLLFRAIGSEEGASEQVGPQHDTRAWEEADSGAAPRELGQESGEREQAGDSSPIAVTIRTVTIDGKEVDGAVVDVVSAGSVVRQLGSTRSGRLEAVLEPLERLRATTPGFEVAEVQFNGEHGAPVDIVLTPLDGIHGFVVTAAGTPLGEGFRVLASPKLGLVPATQLGKGELATQPGTLSALTDSSGRFYLPGLQGMEYRLHAGGQGMLAAQELRGIVAGPTTVLIELHDVLAARVRLVDATTGEDPLLCTDMWSTTAVHSTCLESEVEVKQIPSGTTVMNLLGLDEQPIDPSRTWTEHTCLCIAIPPRESVGPFEFKVNLPGYKQSEASVYATPLRLGIQASVLELQPTASGWGALTLSISGVPDGANRPIDLFMPAGFLKLQSVDGNWLDIGLIELSERRSILTGLPFGSYSARVQLAHGMGKVLVNGADQADIEIGPSDLLLDVGLAFVGAVELELLDTQGRSLDGELHASLKNASGRSTQGLAWKSAPYIVQAIAPGRYAVDVSKPVRLRAADLQDGGWVEVVAGTTTRIRITLP